MSWPYSARTFSWQHNLPQVLTSAQLSGTCLVASSQLCRARSSADAIAAVFPKASRAALEELNEMGYGELEGCKLADVRSTVISVAKRWKAGEVDLRVGRLGGESPADLMSR